LKNVFCVDLTGEIFDDLSGISSSISGAIENESVVVNFRRLGDNNMNSFVVVFGTSDLTELPSSKINFNEFNF
jgi:hypothetical protein